MDEILLVNPGLDAYDIRNTKSQHEEEEDEIQKYLNLPEVQKQLGVHKEWKAENDTVCDCIISNCPLV